MEEATVEGGLRRHGEFRVGAERASGADGRRRGHRGCTLIRIAGDRLADLAQPLLEVRHELAQLGGDGGVGARAATSRRRRPARRARRGQRRRDERRDGGEQGVRQAQPLGEPAERRAGAQRLGDRAAAAAGARRARRVTGKV